MFNDAGRREIDRLQRELIELRRRTGAWGEIPAGSPCTQDCAVISTDEDTWHCWKCNTDFKRVSSQSTGEQT